MSNKKLVDLVNNNFTDKNTVHSYLETYEELLKTRKYTVKKVLEIGIGDYRNSLNVPHGGSLLLWADYFENAENIFGIDIINFKLRDEVKNHKKIITFLGHDAYNVNFIKNNLKDLKFDFILDDGPHTLESQKSFISLYLDLLTENGILIIEDVADINWLDELKKVTPIKYQKYIKTFDLRSKKNRFDDIIFVIDKQI